MFEIPFYAYGMDIDNKTPFSLIPCNKKIDCSIYQQQKHQQQKQQQQWVSTTETATMGIKISNSDINNRNSNSNNGSNGIKNGNEPTETITATTLQFQQLILPNNNQVMNFILNKDEIRPDTNS
ncbi:hypothetical protein ACTA71_010140 [Dictyostelium dimigraforme]